MASFDSVRLSTVRQQVVRGCGRAFASTGGPIVLAVSGGCDSMVMLHVAVSAHRGRIAAVATFDHGTGAASRTAAELVRRTCDGLDVRFVLGGGTGIRQSEAAWRDARWAFLRSVARTRGARVATAHSRDDQVETVLMRALRGSGGRGLAGLYAESAVVRPLLSVDRGTIRAFAKSSGVEFVEDPTNESRRFLRNRIRLDLLPAMRGVCPEIDEQLLDLSRRAAALRGVVDERARELSSVSDAGTVAVAASQLAGYSRESLGVLWQAVAGRVGLSLDRRGTERIAAFTIEGRVAGRVQLSGGWEAYRERDLIELRRMTNGIAEERALGGVRPIQVGAWRFSPGSVHMDDPWTAALPTDMAAVVRPWQPGDRMVAAGTTRPRRVKRFLSDARVSGRHRSRWPVVVSNGEVVWIPGVRRSDAATARPGRSEVSYTCEFDDRR